LATRRQILANVVDKEAGNPNHPEPWLRFAECVGRGSQERTPDRALEGDQEPHRHLPAHPPRRSTAEGLAAFYTYESQIPKLAETKIDGLIRHYNVDGERALAYFYVHINADVEDSKAERAMLEHLRERRQQCGSRREVGGSHPRSAEEILSGVERRHPLAA